MFIQVHNVSENQMNSSFINFSPEDFVEFILSETGKKNIEYLTEISERKIYKIY